MPLLKENVCTIDDIYNLPDGQRAELIDGKIYDMAPPSPLHQKLVGELFASIHAFLKEKGGACTPYVAPFAVFLNADGNTNYVEPDISVICNPEKITDKGCEGAPDFIIEVVSPSSRRTDYNIKNSLYSQTGVREYWIVDPAKERVTIYHYDSDAAPAIYPFADTLPVNVFDGLQICVADLLK